MSRAKTRRPGTRGGRAATAGGFGGRTKKPAGARELPDDLPDAAEAALDDLIAAADAAIEPPEITSQVDVDLDDVTAPPLELSRKRPPPAPRGASQIGRRARSVISELADAELDEPRAVTKRRMTSGSGAVDDDQLVDEHVLAEVASLRFAVYETGEHLASVQGAIAAAGHVVVVGGHGATGLANVAEAVSEDDLDAVVVALPGGEPIIDAAIALEPRRPLVLAAITAKASDAIKRATAAGADLVLARPHDLERCAPVLLAAARIHAERRIAQNARGAEEMLRAKLEELSDPDPRGLQPFEVFQRVLELEFKRARRFEYPLSVALFAVDVPPPNPPAGIRGILRARAGNAIIHTIRDIDIATQLDHERFLILLPYTDLTGAAKLGRRVIAAVAEGDPVVSSGRTFMPRIVGAVAGTHPEQPLSFAKLMKDAQRALDSARRDGAELAVQP